MINTLIKKIKGADYTVPRDNEDVLVWNEWYNGNVKNVHQYSIYNGKNHIPMRMLSLQMAKKVCEDWANILINEQTDIILDTDDASTKLHQILQDSNFWVKANEGVELSFALGYGAFVISVFDLLRDVNDGHLNKDKAKIKVDFVDRHKITPISIVDKNIDEVAFTLTDSHTETYILHVKDDSGNYVIYSYVYDKRDKRLLNEYDFNTGSDVPWFQILRPFVSNNRITKGIDAVSGVSIFANSLDTLHAIDAKYDGFHIEFVLGRRRLYVTEEMWQVHNKKDGTQEKTFNPHDALHYVLPSTDGEQLIKDPTGQLRAESYVSGLNTELNILSSKVGMGENYYRFDYKTGTPTATQVVSENSALFRSKTKHEILIESVLIGLTKAIIYASNRFTNNTFSDVKLIKIGFDDSIIEDKATMLERDKELVNAKLMSPVEFRIKWLDEPEKEAEANYRKLFKTVIIGELLQPLVQGAITPTQFVKEVYGEELQDEIDYITEKLKTGGFDDFASLYGGDE